MKKIYIMGLALAAVFAFSAIAAASSFAEVALWLINGADVTALTSVESAGTLEMIDRGAPGGTSTISCKGILDGSVGAEGEDEITELLETLTGGGTRAISTTVLSGEGLLCTKVSGACEASTTDIEVWAENLPWNTQLELMGTVAAPVFLDKLFKTPSTGPQPAYEVLCLALGINITDLCEGTTSSVITNVATGVEGKFSDAISEEKLQNCELGGAETSEINGSGITKTLTGTLTVSDP